MAPVPPPELDPRFLKDVAGVVGDGNVLTAPGMVAGYQVDWTGRFAGHTPAVVRPGTTGEVAAVVGLCREYGVAVVPQGGNTGLVGGSVPRAGEVVLSLGRLGALEPVDRLAGQVTAGAGVTVGAIQRAAAAAGLRYGVDLASRDSATVGGTIATNAGGLRVLRHGDTRAQVLGVEAVLGTGEVVSHLGGLLRDNTGYDLGGLLTGSEGTLGIVTAARLRLVPAAGEAAVALLAFRSVTEAVEAAAALRTAAPSIEAIELFLRPGLRLVCDAAGLEPPFLAGVLEASAAFVLVEAAGGAGMGSGGSGSGSGGSGSGSGGAAEVLAGAVEGLAGVVEAAVAADSVRRAALWAYRERHTEAINTLGPPHKLDVALPLAALAEFVDAVPAAVEAAAPGARTWLFGHAGDGNVHVNVTGPAPDDESVDETVLRLVASMGGSISAEHGIGTAKKRWLHLNRSPAELSAFRAVKAALDPDGILNPAVLLP